jgi:hypothetical protein
MATRVGPPGPFTDHKDAASEAKLHAELKLQIQKLCYIKFQVNIKILTHTEHMNILKCVYKCVHKKVYSKIKYVLRK